MPRFLGIDVGTTKIAAVVVDSVTGMALASSSAPNESRLSAEGGLSECDADGASELAFAVAAEAVQSAGGGVDGIGVTGQMHGMVLVGGDLAPLGPFIGWQDQRGNRPLGGHPSAIA